MAAVENEVSSETQDLANRFIDFVKTVPGAEGFVVMLRSGDKYQMFASQVDFNAIRQLIDTLEVASQDLRKRSIN